MNKFWCLGLIIHNILKDCDDIDRERRNKAGRGNVLIREYRKCIDEVECHNFLPTATKLMVVLPKEHYVLFESTL